MATVWLQRSGKYKKQKELLTCSYIEPTLWHMVKIRKKAKAKSVKDETIRFRASAEQKAVFEQAAVREGLDLSTWLRRLALKESGQLPEAK